MQYFNYTKEGRKKKTVSVKITIIENHLAAKYGLESAVILSLVKKLMYSSFVNNINFFDGKHWAKIPDDKWNEYLYFVPIKKITSVVNNLISKRVILNKYDFYYVSQEIE